MKKKKLNATAYLKEVYGLEPGDVDLQESDTIEDVERIAKKYGLTKRENMTPKMATLILKRVGIEYDPEGNTWSG